MVIRDRAKWCTLVFATEIAAVQHSMQPNVLKVKQITYVVIPELVYYDTGQTATQGNLLFIDEKIKLLE